MLKLFFSVTFEAKRPEFLLFGNPNSHEKVVIILKSDLWGFAVSRTLWIWPQDEGVFILLPFPIPIPVASVSQ